MKPNPSSSDISAALDQAFSPDVSLTETLPGKWQPSNTKDIPTVCRLNQGLACVEDIDAFLLAAGMKGLTVETVPLDDTSAD